MTQQNSLPWWRTETYDDSSPLPQDLPMMAGPKGLALVRAWPDGRTDVGWGLNPPANSNEGFMPRYMRNEFNERSALYGYNRGKWNFAIIMRSTQLVCVDIDGKNGGLEHAKKLGSLPYTLAETSKSGDGYHLFYIVQEEWDLDTGFGSLSDRIGIEQGVDFRATGCVYHHPQQKWNGRSPALLPQHLYDLLKQRAQRQAATAARITSVLESGDTMEILMLHDDLISKLNKPIPEGKRNNTLFAIGSEMVVAGIAKWDEIIRARAEDLDLDSDETEKLVANISRYAVPATP